MNFWRPFSNPVFSWHWKKKKKKTTVAADVPTGEIEAAQPPRLQLEQPETTTSPPDAQIQSSAAADVDADRWIWRRRGTNFQPKWYDEAAGD